uniref:Uncharacterized protein n=1 Tax=Tolypothrix bouteillei VB521301 TaxID=1479485 RepID=A0A0C1QLY4_9CYAN
MGVPQGALPLCQPAVRTLCVRYDVCRKAWLATNPPQLGRENGGATPTWGQDERTGGGSNVWVTPLAGGYSHEGQHERTWVTPTWKLHEGTWATPTWEQHERLAATHNVCATPLAGGNSNVGSRRGDGGYPQQWWR